MSTVVDRTCLAECEHNSIRCHLNWSKSLQNSCQLWKLKANTNHWKTKIRSIDSTLIPIAYCNSLIELPARVVKAHFFFVIYRTFSSCRLAWKMQNKKKTCDNRFEINLQYFFTRLCCIRWQWKLQPILCWKSAWTINFYKFPWSRLKSILIWNIAKISLRFLMNFYQCQSRYEVDWLSDEIRLELNIK